MYQIRVQNDPHGSKLCASFAPDSCYGSQKSVLSCCASSSSQKQVEIAIFLMLTLESVASLEVLRVFGLLGWFWRESIPLETALVCPSE